MVSRGEWRNGGIGIGVSFAILAIALVFFSDAGEHVLAAIGMFAFVIAFVVAHTLDALEGRRNRER
jgi:multisubunit Na+/H+ antiporter MnhG subunit